MLLSHQCQPVQLWSTNKYSRWNLVTRRQIVPKCASKSTDSRYRTVLPLLGHHILPSLGSSAGNSFKRVNGVSFQRNCGAASVGEWNWDQRKRTFLGSPVQEQFKAGLGPKERHKGEGVSRTERKEELPTPPLRSSSNLVSSLYLSYHQCSIPQDTKEGVPFLRSQSLKELSAEAYILYYPKFKRFLMGSHFSSARNWLALSWLGVRLGQCKRA